MSDQILNENVIFYKEGERITGNEKVIKIEIEAGVTCHHISENYFKVSTEGLTLCQNNFVAIKALRGRCRDIGVIRDWPKAKELPEWIYFCKKTGHITSNQLEKFYENVIPSVELNVFAAFNTKYPDFRKTFPNAIQRNISRDVFHSACCIENSLRIVPGTDDWYGCWWFMLGW